MKRNLLWRGLLILGLLALSVFLAYPPGEKINLGLDLQGGMHMVLQVHTEDALRAETDADMERLLRQATEAKLAGVDGRRTGDTVFEIVSPAPEAQGQIADLAERYLGARWSSTRQGNRTVFTMSATEIAAIREGATNQARQTIDNRINQYGVAEPDIRTASGHRVVVQLPGVDDPERIRRLIKNVAFLEFRLVRFPQGGGGVPSREAIVSNFGGRLPENLEILEGDLRDADKNVVGEQYYAVEKRRTVTGRDLKNARVGQGQFRDPVVEFSFSPAGAEAFGELTGNNVGSGLAIVLDGRVVSAPRINSRISDSGIIEGGFDPDEAQDLSMVLKSGALPAGLTVLEERTVGPSLGRESIRNGIISGLIGTALVILYIMIVYNLSGLNAVAALGLSLVLLMGGLAAFNATLTLPGIAGILLTIGMSVDANVLIFERIREELHAGRSIRSSVDLGFEKALSSIIDSNVTTLIAALFLFQFGTGPIKGFAVTLTIGLLASMFTAIFVSRWLFDAFLSRVRVQRLSI